MANVLKIKRGSSVPSSSDLAVYELGYRTGTNELYINDNGTYRQVGSAGSGGGDIEGVTAGTGLSGGGTSGTVTLTNAGVTSIVAGSNISISGATGAVTVTGTDTNTTYTGGTNLTLSGTTFNVDDKFLKNDASDTTSGTITAGGFTTTGVVRNTNNANADGPNFNVSTTNKTTGEYAYRVDRSGSVVGGILIDGKGAFASGSTVGGSAILTSVPNHSAALLTSGTLPVARLANIADSHIASDAQISGSKIADAFLKNNASDTTSGTITAAGFVSTGGVQLASELDFTGNGNKIVDVYTLANSNTFRIRHHNPSGNVFHDGLVLTGNAGAKLYYNNGLKFQTTNTGADLTGEFIVNPNVNSNASVIILKNSGLTNSGLLRIAIPAGNGSYANNATLNDIVFRNETTGGSIIIGAKDDVKIGAGGGDYDTRMIVNSSGRVGIGTVSPASPLNVKSNSSSSSDSGITLTQNGGSNAIFKMGEKSTDGGRFHMYDSGVEKIAFYTDGTANHISAGNVGIGVASPAKLLDVDGVGKFRGGSSEGQVLELGQLSYNAAVGAISISYWDDTAGGTSSLTSGDHLEIYHGRWGATTTIARGGQGGAVPVASLYGAGSSAWLELYQPDSPTTNNNYTTKVRLRADGDSYFTNELGIGTTSPDTLLHIVNAGSGGTTTLKLEDNAREMFLGRDTIKVTTLDGSTAAQLYIGSNTTFSGTVTTGGNLAMGGAITGITGLYGASGTLTMYNNTYNFKNATSGQMMGLTSAGLMLKNNTFFMAEDADGDDINILGIHSNNNCYVGPSSNAWAGGAMLYGAASGTNAHVWYEGNAEIMRIADNGFLGIGTNSPASLLDVDGIMSMGVADATRPALTPTNWGYATTYRALMLGSSSTTYNTANTGSTTISMGYNPSGNSYNGFNGDGREILFRRGAQFVTPNAADNSMYLYNLVMLDGKIGIGTASPAAPLSVEIPNSGNTSGQELSRWTHSGQNTLSLYAYGGATDLMQFGAWNSEQNISIVTDSSGSISATNTKGIFIKSGGNVGIGNVSPGAKLHIGSRGTASDPSISSLDGIMFDFYNAGNPYQRKASIISNSADTSEAIMAFWTTAASGSASQKMTINGAGNVGIGVASPSRPLVVNGSSATFLSIVSGASDDGGILFGDSGADYDGQIRYNNSTHHMFFKTNNIEQMRISATGKFSIGNTNDSYKLDVTGNVRFTSDLRNEGRLLNSVGSASSPSYSFYSQGTAGMYRRGDGVGFSAGSTERVYIDASKMMITGAGVNTFRIQFPNDQRIFDNGSGGLKMGSASHELDLYSGSDPIRMYTGGIAGTERMRVHTDGKIGIGTTAPSFVLKVNVDNATYTDWETIAGFQSKRGADSETEAGLMINAIGDAMGGQISSNWYWTDNTGAKGNTGRSAGIFGISNSASSNSEFYWQNTAHNNTTLTTRMKIDNAHSLHVDADVVAYSSSVSDERFKDNIKTIPNALDKVMQLRGVEFDWNATSRKGQHDLGVVAQEVEKVLPELVKEKILCTGEFTDNEKEFKTVDYDKMVAVLIEAVKQQQVQIDELKTQIGE